MINAELGRVMTVMTFAGVARRVPEVKSFVWPVFRNGGGDFFFQDPSQFRHASFVPANLGEEFIPISSSIKVAEGDAALYGFEIDECAFILGDVWALASALNAFLDRKAEGKQFSGAKHLEVQRFVDEVKSYPPAEVVGELIMVAGEPC